MPNIITSSVHQSEHQSIDLDNAFVSNTHESIIPGPYYGSITFTLKRGGKVIWEYGEDQIKQYEHDLKTLGHFK